MRRRVPHLDLVGISSVRHDGKPVGVEVDARGAELAPTYRASPYLGEHNFDLYPQLLGLDEGEVSERMGDGLFT